MAVNRAYPTGATADRSGHRCRVLATWREPAGWCCEVLEGWEGESPVHRSWSIGDIGAAAEAGQIEASLARRTLDAVVSGVQEPPAGEGFVVVQESRRSRWMRATTRHTSGLPFVVRWDGARVARGPVGVVRLPIGRRRIYVGWETVSGSVDRAGHPIEVEVASQEPTLVVVSFPAGVRIADGNSRDRLDHAWRQWRRDGRTMAAP